MSAATLPDAGAPRLDWDRFVAVADAVATRFVERTRPMPERIPASILFSDGLCFCALCELYSVDAVLEGGTGFGGSTEMFARYLDPGRVRGIWSVDHAVNPRWEWWLAKLRIKRYSPHTWSTSHRAHSVARARLSPFRHVHLVRGDAHVRLPRLASRLLRQGASVGVLLDGPKGDEQLCLADRLLSLSPRVRFVAVDDIGPMFDREGRGVRFRAHAGAAFATSDRAFFDRFAWVNEGRLPGRMAGRADHTGYGMGVLVNRL